MSATIFVVRIEPVLALINDAASRIPSALPCWGFADNSSVPAGELRGGMPKLAAISEAFGKASGMRRRPAKYVLLPVSQALVEMSEQEIVDLVKKHR